MSNIPKIPEGWVFWRDQQGNRWMDARASDGSVLPMLVSYAYDPTDYALRIGGSFNEACGRGAAARFELYPVRAMQAGIQDFDSLLPEEPK